MLRPDAVLIIGLKGPEAAGAKTAVVSVAELRLLPWGCGREIGAGSGRGMCSGTEAIEVSWSDLGFSNFSWPEVAGTGTGETGETGAS